MKPIALAIISLAVLALSGVPADAAGGGGGLLESYVARLSPRDHFNSYGERLTTAAGIIRQDRANYHVYGRQDREDQDDAFFGSAANRARLEYMLLQGRARPRVIRAIVNGNPLIRVDVYPNYVRVTLL